MSQRLRIYRPPPSGSASLDAWLNAAADAINTLPNMSIISTSNGPNSSALTGNSGDIAIDVGSSATTFWFKRIGTNTTSGWSAVDFA